MPSYTLTERPASVIHDATRDPAAMTPEERRREIAAILAKGVLRLRRNGESLPGSRPDRMPEKDLKKVSYSLDGGCAKKASCV